MNKWTKLSTQYTNSRFYVNVNNETHNELFKNANFNTAIRMPRKIKNETVNLPNLIIKTFYENNITWTRSSSGPIAIEKTTEKLNGTKTNILTPLKYGFLNLSEKSILA